MYTSKCLFVTLDGVFKGVALFHPDGGELAGESCGDVSPCIKISFARPKGPLRINEFNKRLVFCQLNFTRPIKQQGPKTNTTYCTWIQRASGQVQIKKCGQMGVMSISSNG